MPNYKIKLKTAETGETVKADSELEAKYKYCENRGLPYRYYANKLEILQKTRPDKTR
ncbi:MAG TPA: hypothetical protein PLC05_03560 [bacterium]|nr:hypothetical protein [bacterium]